MQIRRIVAVGATVLALAACDTGDGRTMTSPVYPPPATTTPSTSVPEPELRMATMFLHPSWPDGGELDPEVTCDGADVSPALSWSNVPPGAAELAIAVSDLDADGFVHWIVSGLRPDAFSLAEGEVPDGAVVYRNSWGAAAWGGPCPPAGELHTYQFNLYALPGPLDVTATATPGDVIGQLESIAIEKAVAGGTYQRRPATSG